eukprot:TRINITY_DN423_c0_g1_i12.p11 TRINITY_DN423_c0_g1~~TRINITY_DN423_c0_g1_i12.p11  ORF type:complete len:229 (+),score=31.11 TRINITY_DN423_c0_g1_i12:3669-4355(+)
MLCNIQYSHPEIYPLYLTLNNDVERSPAIAYTYKVTGTLNFKGYETLPGNSCKCRLEATMINSLKQYREELTQCVMKADGEIAIEEIKEIKEEKKEEPLTTFKIGMSEKEQEERKKIKGPYHTGVEEQFEGMKIEEEEDINDDEGENFQVVQKLVTKNNEHDLSQLSGINVDKEGMSVGVSLIESSSLEQSMTSIRSFNASSKKQASLFLYLYSNAFSLSLSISVTNF